MSEPTRRATSALPDAPNLEWLRKQARRRLAELRAREPDRRLADAQRDLAREYGFPSWRALKAHVDSLTTEGQLFDAAEKGEVRRVASLLDADANRLHARRKPYAWTLLHTAAHAGHLPVVDLLLQRGLDVNVRERGDNTYAMHWAAAAAHLDVVRRLADAGGDVVGRGDDHQLEVIGWATCWEGCDDDAHRAVAAFLVSRGAQHHIFSAIALNLGQELRRIVRVDPGSLEKPMSRNEGFQRPLHFAVRMNRPEMVQLLLELGADPLGTDGSGADAAMYASAPGSDRALMETLRARGAFDLRVAVAVHDWPAASAMLRDDPRLMQPGGSQAGLLHQMAKRNDAAAVQWLLEQGADPNGRWDHWDAEVTPLHLAAMHADAAVVQLLLDAGANVRIRDSKHDSDPIGWAEHTGRAEIVRQLEAHERGTR